MIQRNIFILNISNDISSCIAYNDTTIIVIIMIMFTDMCLNVS
jgi:hypothetical protein